MGATLYRLLVGKPPLGETAADIMRGLVTHQIPRSVTEAGVAVPPYVEEAIARALDPDREKRPADANEFRDLLTKDSGTAETVPPNVATELTMPPMRPVTSVTQPPTPTPTPTAKSKVPLLIGVGGLVAAGVVIVAIAPWSRSGSTQPDASPPADVTVVIADTASPDTPRAGCRRGE